MRGRFFVVLALCACHDAGKDTLDQVKTQYAALLGVGTPAQSRDFDALVRELDSIPESSRAHREAAALKAAILAARGPRIERPLAVPANPLPDLGAPALQAKLEATRAECERHVKELSALEGEARHAKLELLGACRRRADALVGELEHAQEDGGAR